MANRGSLCSQSRRTAWFEGDPNIEKCGKFSETLDATFFDGREAFQGLSHQQIKDDWFPIDAHWNRGGQFPRSVSNDGDQLSYQTLLFGRREHYGGFRS